MNCICPKLQRQHCHVLIMLATVAIFAASRANAADCKEQQTIPSNQSRIGGGFATPGKAGVTTIKGDKTLYIQIKNSSEIAVAYTATLARDTTQFEVICTYAFVLGPRTSVLLSGATFAAPPIDWKITVSIEHELPGVLTYLLFSLNPLDKAPSALTSSIEATGLSPPAPVQDSDSRNSAFEWRHSKGCPTKVPNAEDLLQLSVTKCRNIPILCKYDPVRENILLKDKSASKPAGYLVMPAGHTISGIEDTAVLRQPVMDLWEDAWLEQENLNLPRGPIGMAVNARCKRSEGQLHIHVSCVQPNVISTLDSNEDAVRSSYAMPAEVSIGSNVYHVIRVNTLTGESSPFRVVQKLTQGRDEMGGQGVAVVPSQESGKFWVLMTTYTGEGEGGLAEAVLDQQCKILAR